MKFPLALPCPLSSLLLATAVIGASMVPPALAETTRAQAISTVRSILRSNAAACRLKTHNITAKRIAKGWRVTANVTLRSGGGPNTTTTAWNVVGGRAAPASQLSSEISHGCP
jgi:hypothetical protein